MNVDKLIGTVNVQYVRNGEYKCRLNVFKIKRVILSEVIVNRITQETTTHFYCSWKSDLEILKITRQGRT